MPQRSSVVATRTAGQRRSRGSGARKEASSPAGTTVGEPPSSAATRAASLLPAIPVHAGTPAASAAAARAWPAAVSEALRESPAKWCSMPVTSR